MQISMSNCSILAWQTGEYHTPACQLNKLIRNINDSIRFDVFMTDTFFSHSDEELLAEIAQQNHSAFSELVKRYSSKLYNVAYRILSNRNDAEDMVQEVFMKLWNNPDIWNEKYNSKFSTFFYKVLTNQCIDHKRRNSYRYHDEFNDTQSGEISTDAIMEKKSKSDLINKYIKELPERQQIALNLCYYESLTSTEVAEIMDLSPKGVQSLVLRAKENLRNKLRVFYEKQVI
jgi:RNA polymerase sigma-70 factor, ECF subfamily